MLSSRPKHAADLRRSAASTANPRLTTVKTSSIAKTQSSKRKRASNHEEVDLPIMRKDPKQPTKTKRARKTQPPFSTFTIFRELPSELRWKIWGMAADSDAAVIALVKPAAVLGYKLVFSLVRSGSLVPSLLHACRESRTECIVDDPIKRLEEEKIIASPSRESIEDAAARGAKTYREALAMIAADAAREPATPLRNTVHARWSLKKFKNSRLTYSAYPARRLYVSPNDIVWFCDLPTVRATPIRNNLPEDLRHVAGSINKIEWENRTTGIKLKQAFPALQTITYLVDDYTHKHWPEPRLPRKYYNLSAEINGELTTEGLEEAEKSSVEAGVSRIKNPERGEDIGYGLWGYRAPPQKNLSKEETATLMEGVTLKFRFGIQFAKKEIPELGKKPKYKRPTLT